MENQEIKHCPVKTCGVPMHLHNTCCGWVNASLIVSPQTPQEQEWRDKWIEANPNVYAPKIECTNNVEDKLIPFSHEEVVAMQKLIKFAVQYAENELSGNEALTDSKIAQQRAKGCKKELEIYLSIGSKF